MRPTAQETDAAQRRLNEVADMIDLNYHLVQLSPQVAKDIRTLTARRLMLEGETKVVAKQRVPKDFSFHVLSACPDQNECPIHPTPLPPMTVSEVAALDWPEDDR